MSYAFTLGELPEGDVDGWLARTELERVGETESVLRLSADGVRLTVYKAYGRVRLEGANASDLAAKLGLTVVAQVVRPLPGAPAPRAAELPPEVNGVSKLPHAGTLEGTLTEVDAADVPGWLDRARNDLEAYGGKVHVEPGENLLVAGVEFYGARVQVAATADGGNATARVHLYGTLPPKRVAACLNWLADLLELTPVAAPQVNPQARVEVVHRRRGGKSSETFLSTATWDVAPDDFLGALGDLLS